MVEKKEIKHIKKGAQENFLAHLFYLGYHRFANPGSSSGRTEDSGSSNGGSNPSPGVFVAEIYINKKQI